MTKDQGHISVLRNEAIVALNLKADGVYIDATFGRGGHSYAILNELSKDGRVLALDCDAQAVEHAQRLFADEPRFFIRQCNFSEIGKAAAALGVVGTVDGILFDLGVSSPQLDQAGRGFSFDRDGPLDMRLDQARGRPVSEWLSEVAAEELAIVFKEYGEERYAKRIAAKVIEARDRQIISTTRELAEIIKLAHPRWQKGKHPATRCFQALRIFINRELDHLQQALDSCADLLRPGGRLVVISFHSLEDRIVKRFIRGKIESKVTVPRGLPVQPAPVAPSLVKIGRAIKPSDGEISSNPRARSSIMRIAEKPL
ncbi:16S rRNA (cytosine(1402)-N(4))-methyltransferase [Chromatiales bacterium (ex Bugula neritina AB1)]|nr:16S rRNA (cytosine(1402)-N(4))-methyltransferase [Chromatiales bacterium (ex Bugula neritina AB1)]